MQDPLVRFAGRTLPRASGDDRRCRARLCRLVAAAHCGGTRHPRPPASTSKPLRCASPLPGDDATACSLSATASSRSAAGVLAILSISAAVRVGAAMSVGERVMRATSRRQPFRRECGENGGGARLRRRIPSDNRRLPSVHTVNLLDVHVMNRVYPPTGEQRETPFWPRRGATQPIPRSCSVC